jgi:hypothetical protein
MPKCTDDRIEFGKLGRRLIEADFSGGDLSSDGGMMLLRQVDERIGLTRACAAKLSDPRGPDRVVHPLRDLLAQRIYALCCGHEDLNDHQRLREDVLVQTALGRDQALASAATLCRLEKAPTRGQCAALHEVLIEQFIASYEKPPQALVLNIDASDVPLHGQQELREFHGRRIGGPTVSRVAGGLNAGSGSPAVTGKAVRRRAWRPSNGAAAR